MIKPTLFKPYSKVNKKNAPIGLNPARAIIGSCSIMMLRRNFYCLIDVKYPNGDLITPIIRWLGHASFQVKASDKILYIDLMNNKKAVKTTEKADLILVTHGHADHCNAQKIEKVTQKDTVIIGPKDCVKKFRGNTKTLKPGDSFTLNGLIVQAVEAYNVKRYNPSGKPWHPKGYGVGYLIQAEGKTIYHAGDTCLIPEMKDLRDIDVALLPTGDKYTMDNAEAAEAALLIKPKIAVSMHSWKTDREVFKKKVGEKSGVKVVLLEEGEELQI